METPRNFEQKESEPVIYTALFVDNIEALKGQYPPVHPNTFYHHSTIAFRPQDGKNGIEVGKKLSIKIIGRVTTEKVDALLVENPKSANAYPHITLSTAEGIKPFVSNDEVAQAVKNNTVIPVTDTLEVTEGYFNGKTDVVE